MKLTKEPPRASRNTTGVLWPAQRSRPYATPSPASSRIQIWAFTWPRGMAPEGMGR